MTIGTGLALLLGYCILETVVLNIFLAPYRKPAQAYIERVCKNEIFLKITSMLDFVCDGFISSYSFVTSVTNAQPENIDGVFGPLTNAYRKFGKLVLLYIGKYVPLNGKQSKIPLTDLKMMVMFLYCMQCFNRDILNRVVNQISEKDSWDEEIHPFMVKYNNTIDGLFNKFGIMKWHATDIGKEFYQIAKIYRYASKSCLNDSDMMEIMTTLIIVHSHWYW